MKFSISAMPYDTCSGPIVLGGHLDKSFALAAELGYDGLEIHLRDAHDIDWEKLVNLSKTYKLAVSALGTGMAAREDGLTFTDQNKDVRQQAVERVKEHIKLAARLGSLVIIGSVSGYLGKEERERKRHFTYALSCLDECCQAGINHDVTLLLEPLNRYECDYINTLDEALEVINRIGAPNMRLLADTFHMNIEERDIITSLHRAGKALGYVHLADSNRKMPGQGHLNISQVLKVLQDIEYHGFIGFEVLPLPDAHTVALESVSFVKELLKGGAG